jgi:hypothetical protein
MAPGGRGRIKLGLPRAWSAVVPRASAMQAYSWAAEVPADVARRSATGKIDARRSPSGCEPARSAPMVLAEVILDGSRVRIFDWCAKGLDHLGDCGIPERHVRKRRILAIARRIKIGRTQTPSDDVDRNAVHDVVVIAGAIENRSRGLGPPMTLPARAITVCSPFCCSGKLQVRKA